MHNPEPFIQSVHATRGRAPTKSLTLANGCIIKRQTAAAACIRQPALLNQGLCSCCSCVGAPDYVAAWHARVPAVYTAGRMYPLRCSHPPSNVALCGSKHMQWRIHIMPWPNPNIVSARVYQSTHRQACTPHDQACRLSPKQIPCMHIMTHQFHQ